MIRTLILGRAARDVVKEIFGVSSAQWRRCRALLERVCGESLCESATRILACTPEQARQAVDDFAAHADEVTEAGDIDAEFRSMLAAFLYSAHIHHAPLLIAGPNGCGIADALSMPLYAEGSGQLLLGEGCDDDIAAGIQAHRERIVSVRNMFGRGWSDELPQALEGYLNELLESGEWEPVAWPENTEFLRLDPPFSRGYWQQTPGQDRRVSLARYGEGGVLFPARMHMFFRGTKGVYACTNPARPVWAEDRRVRKKLGVYPAMWAKPRVDVHCSTISLWIAPAPETLEQGIYGLLSGHAETQEKDSAAEAALYKIGSLLFTAPGWSSFFMGAAPAGGRFD